MTFLDIRSFLYVSKVYTLPLRLSSGGTAIGDGVYIDQPFTSPLRAFFCHEAVQTGLLFPERGSIRVLLLAPSPISPWHDLATTSGFGGSQADIGSKG